MNNLRRDTQLTLLSRIPTMLLSFIAVVLLTRLLGPEGNGVYTFTAAVLNLFLTVIGFQLNTSLTYFLSTTEQDRPKVFSTIGIFSFLSINVFCILLTILVFVIPQFSFLFIPPDQPVIFFFCFLMIAFILRLVVNLILAALRGLLQFKLYNLFMVILQLIPVIFYSVLLWLTLKNNININLVTYFKIILLSETVSLSIGVFLLIKNKGLTFSPDYKTYQKRVYNYSSKNLLSVLGNFLNKRLDVWFVQFLKGTTTLGYYGLATQITNFVTEAMTPFNQVLLPHLAGSDATQHHIMVGKIARINFFIALCLGLLIAVTAGLFIPLLFGPQFSEAITSTQILSAGIILLSLRLVFTNYFKGVNQFKYLITASWLGVVITIILDILLIPDFGIVGASLATIAAYSLSTTFLVYHACKTIGLSVKDILLVRWDDIKWLLSGSMKG